MRAEPVADFLDLGHALLAALFDDVGCAVLTRQFLPRLVSAHRDDPVRPNLLRREHTEQTDCTVTNHGNDLARAGFGSYGTEPASAKHIRGGEEARDQVVGGHIRG